MFCHVRLSGLAEAPIPEGIFRGVHVPMMDANTTVLRQPWLKPGDRLWSGPKGRHFFHHEYSQRVRQVILEFWPQANCQSNMSLVELAR